MQQLLLSSPKEGRNAFDIVGVVTAGCFSEADSRLQIILGNKFGKVFIFRISIQQK